MRTYSEQSKAESSARSTRGRYYPRGQDATEWVARTLLLGANIGVGPEVSASIVLDALSEIRAAVADRLERERAEGRLRGDD
jgi:hypothetical protein